MTARKIAVAVVLCGVALYFLVTWGIDWFRARDQEPEAPEEPEPERVEGVRFTTTASDRGAPELIEPWRAAFASPDIPLGAVVSVGEFGDDAERLTVRQRGDVVASELRVVAHRDDLAPRTVAAYVGDLGDDFTLEGVTLLIRDKEATG
jgi:hypothetical protein